MTHEVVLHRDHRDGAARVHVVFTGTAVDLHEREDRADATARHERIGQELGVPVVRMGQVHEDGVAVVEGPEPSLVPGVDALVTRTPGVALAARGADCALVLLADADAAVVGAVHCGRRGLVAGVLPAAVRRLRALGAGDLHAWVGPHVCGRCYEVPEQMRQEVARSVPEAAAETSWGTPAVDLGAGVLAQLTREEVTSDHLEVCTMEDDRVWSHRRDGERAGRVAGLVWVAP